MTPRTLTAARRLALAVALLAGVPAAVPAQAALTPPPASTAPVGTTTPSEPAGPAAATDATGGAAATDAGPPAPSVAPAPDAPAPDAPAGDGTAADTSATSATAATSATDATSGTSAAAVAAAGVQVTATTLPAAPDYASEAFSDPWDYSGPSDASVVPGYDSWGATGLRYSGGELGMTMARGGWLTLTQDVTGALPRERDTRVQPMDAGRFTRFSTRMWSSTATTMQVYWFSCGENLPRCAGATQVAVQPGWNLYDIPLRNTTGLPVEWSGSPASMRVVPAATTNATVAFDFVRVYAPSAASRTTVTSSSSGTLVADPDRDPGNGNDVRLRTVGSGSTVVDLSALAAGGWNLGVRSSGTLSYAPATTQLGVGPLPVVLQPDVAGGRSYAAVVRGDEWDFDQASDVLGYENVAGARVAGGSVHGTNGAPSQNDPQVKLRLGGTPIDGDRFHRLTVTMHQDGPFGLEDGPGGGMMTRVVWQTAGAPAAYQDLEDVVVSPGLDTFSVDLATDPPAAITDPSIPRRIGWAGQQITSLRLDPNEDRGARSWRVDEVRVAEDDRPTQGRFDIVFEDRAATARTTASVYVDRDGSGFDGTLVARDVPVTAGRNTVSWATRGVADGRWWPYVVISDGTQTRRSYATGPVRVEQGADRAVPLGTVDQVLASPGGATASGWALDPAAPGGTTDVHVYADGGLAATVRATASRPDVGAAYPAFGAAHGWSVRLGGLSTGSHQVCAYAFTGPAGPNPALGCRTVQVVSDPFGNVERTTRVPGGVRVDGWVVDGSTDRSTEAHVWTGGRLATTPGTLSRPDVAASFPGYGAAHGLSVVVPLTAGSHRPCVYGIDIEAPGTNRLLRCLDVQVSSDPFGAVDSVTRVDAGRVRLRGWALDPDTERPTDVHVWQGGALRAVVPATGARTDVAAAHPGYGAAHGVDAVVPAGAGTLCAYAVDVVAPGGSRLLGCREV